MLAVIIVNYNAGSLLASCLAAVCEAPQVAQVILVDNGSRDDSLALVRRRFSREPRLFIIPNDANLGFSRANNQALEKLAPETEYVLFLNPDCLLTAGVLERMLTLMAAEPRVGLAGCLITNPDGSEQRGCRRRLPTPWNTVGALLPGRRAAAGRGDFNLHGTPLPSGPVPVEAISGSFMFARRQAIAAVNGFDEGYFLHCEDLDLCHRLRLAGWQVFFVPDVRVIHHQGRCSHARPLQVSWHKHRGMERFYRKFHRRRYGWPMYLLVKTAIWGHFALKIPRNLWGSP